MSGTNEPRAEISDIKRTRNTESEHSHSLVFSCRIEAIHADEVLVGIVERTLSEFTPAVL